MIASLLIVLAILVLTALYGLLCYYIGYQDGQDHNQ